MSLLEVRGAPNYYACEQGILGRLPSFLGEHRLTNPLILHGEKSLRAAQPYLPTNLAGSFEPYNRECSLEEIDRIASLVDSRKHDVIIGIGGGKILDLAKAVGNETSLPVILIPTLAATCAAWTPLSVIYDQSGRFLHYTIYPRSTLAVLIEPNIFVSSPIAYLRAGIADTLAKWYEADVLIRQEPFKSLAIQIAHQTAKLCQTNLLSDSLKAIADLEIQELSPELLRVIETNIMAGGMVGGYGDRFGRISGAHSIHNGLTQISETHHLLHGEKVAYGILIQLMLENNQEEITNLLPFYYSLNLPTCLSDLGIKENINKLITTISYHATLPHESIHFIGQKVTEEQVKGAIFELEKLTNNVL